MKRSYEFLYLSRWVAAAAVVVYHIRQVIFAPMDHGASAGTFVFYVVTAFGQEAVVVFFVLSGFLVGGLSLEKRGRGRFDLLDYSSHRFARIYIVFIPSHALTLACDLIGGQLAPSTYAPPLVHDAGYSVADLIGNIFMLGGVLVPRFGSNAPSWSLVNEWWYYVLFGCAIAALPDRRWSVRAAGVLVAVVVLSVLPISAVLLGAGWAIGVAVWVYVERRLTAPPLWAAGLALAVGLAISFLLRRHAGDTLAWWRYYGANAAVAIGFSALLLAVVARGDVKLPFPKTNKFLADFSYSIYLIHYPVTLMVVSALKAASLLPARGEPSAAALGCFCLCLAVIYPLGVVFYFCFERNTAALRRLAHGLANTAGGYLSARFAPAP